MRLIRTCFVGRKPETFADGILSLSPDDFTFRAGVTTVVDAELPVGEISLSSRIK